MADRDLDGLRAELRHVFEVGNAHVDFERAIENLAPGLRGTRPAGLPHSPWRLVEHMRIAQRDILDFCRDPGHESPPFPEGYWPDGDAPPDADAWDRAVAGFRADLAALIGLAADPATDLVARLPHGTGQSILREVLLVADHNAYHIGQLVCVRRLLGDWDA